MTPLRKLLQEFEDVRFAKNEESARFSFNTEKERFVLIQSLNALQAEYMLYNPKGMYSIEVFFND